MSLSVWCRRWIFSQSISTAQKLQLDSVGWLFPLAEFGRGAAVQVEKTQPVQPLLEAHLALLNRFSPARSIKIPASLTISDAMKAMFVAMVCTKLADLYGILGNISAVLPYISLKAAFPRVSTLHSPPCRVSRAKELLSSYCFFNSWHLAIQKQSNTCINIYIYINISIYHIPSLLTGCLMMSYVKMQIIPIFVQNRWARGQRFARRKRDHVFLLVFARQTQLPSCVLPCVMPCTGLVLVRVVPVVCLLSREWWQRCAPEW